MVCLRMLALLGVLATSSLTAEARQQNGTDNAGSGVYILECDEGQLPAIANAIKQRGGTIRHEYDSSIFRGVSFQMPNATGNGDIRAELTKTGLVKSIWSSKPAADLERAGDAEQPDAQQDTQQDAQQREKRIPRALDGFANASKPGGGESYWAHEMMNVDKLHEEGYLGDGVRIAVIDSGVDYTHPALGGCFGPGCRVAKGADLINKTGDPMDYIGHGTAVASVLAGYDAETGFMGVAPKATIHAYRVVGGGKELPDTIMAGWLKAYDDGAHVMTSSAGETGSWAEGPLALVVSRTVAKGIPCIVAFGNERLPFKSNVASLGGGVVAVGSVSHDLGPRIDHGVYRIDNGNETVFKFVAGTPGAWGGEALEVHDLDADYDGIGDNMTDPDNSHLDGQAADDCRLSPGEVDVHGNKTLDLAGHVALIRSFPPPFNCDFEQRMLNARDRGATHVLAWLDATGGAPLGFLEGPQEFLGIGMADSAVGDALANALAAGKKATMRRQGRLTAGAILRDSTYGPTYRLDVKPNVLAPGRDISAAVAKGGYSLVHGTSIAAPLIAGVYALVGQARGTFNAALLNSFILGTAEPQAQDPSDNTSGLISVARQGSGLVRAWEAAHATTIIDPTSLAFNDTINRAPSLGLRIYNPSNTITVQYQLSHIEALTLYALNRENRRAPDQTIQAPARVQLSKSQITLDPGEDAVIDISASDPEGVQVERLPLWSGWIAIQGSDGTRRTVPYLGLAGSFREAAVWSSPRGNLSNVQHSIVVMAPLPWIPGLEPPDLLTDIDWSAGYDTRLNVKAALPLALGGSPEIQLYAVPFSICPDRGINGTAPVLLNLTRTCVPEAFITEVGATQTIGQIADSPYYYVEGDAFRPSWNGSLSSGQYAPPGRYKLIARALSFMGDRNNQSHWQVAETPEFTFAYMENKDGKRLPVNRPWYHSTVLRPSHKQ